MSSLKFGENDIRFSLRLTMILVCRELEPTFIESMISLDVGDLQQPCTTDQPPKSGSRAWRSGGNFFVLRSVDFCVSCLLFLNWYNK